MLIWTYVNLTSVTDHAYWGWGEKEYPLLQKNKLPQGEDVCTKELNELREAASRVGYL